MFQAKVLLVQVMTGNPNLKLRSSELKIATSFALALGTFMPLMVFLLSFCVGVSTPHRADGQIDIR